MKNRKVLLVFVGVLLALSIILGTSYALWSLSLIQTSENTVSAACFQVEFQDKNPITLENGFPIRDADGKKLVPYEFTITNICDDYASFQVNLEVLENSTLEHHEYMKMMVNEKSPRVLTKYNVVEKTLDNATTAYKLDYGYLDKQESKTYELRLWIDENVTLESEGIFHTTFSSKVTVTTSYAEKMPGTLRSVSRSTSNGMWAYKSSISKIVIQNELKPIEGAIQEYDESSNGDGSVMSYVVKNEEGYVAYLQSTDKVLLNLDSSYLFHGFSSVKKIEGIEYLDTSNVSDMSFMFSDMRGLISLDVSSFDTSNVTNMASMFFDTRDLVSLDVSSFDTSNVIDMSAMFRMLEMDDDGRGNSSLIHLNLGEKFDTSNVTNMSEMFGGLSSLTDLNVSGFNTSNVLNMSYMFYNLSELTSLDVSSFDTSKVTDMTAMFNIISSLTDLDLSNFDTSKVTDMSYMFSGMNSLISLNVSSFDTTNVENMSNMFGWCSSLTNLDVSSFDTTSVKDMGNMFFHTMGLTSLNLSGFDTSNVTNMRYMFSLASNLTNITFGDNFVHKSDSNIIDMFYNCPANRPTHESWNGAF